MDPEKAPGYGRARVRQKVGMNWRSRPLEDLVLFLSEDPSRQMSPAPPEEVALLRHATRGARRRADAPVT